VYLPAERIPERWLYGTYIGIALVYFGYVLKFDSKGRLAMKPFFAISLSMALWIIAGAARAEAEKVCAKR
jgi:hypothetical protein